MQRLPHPPDPTKWGARMPPTHFFKEVTKHEYTEF